MAIPKFDAILSPLLHVANDGEEHRLNDIIAPLATQMGLTAEELDEKMASGGNRFRNRVYWAKLYLSQARAIHSPRAGCFTITDRGRELLARSTKRITLDDLMAFDEFREFKTRSNGREHKVRGVDKDLTVTVPEKERDDANLLGAEVRESHRIQALLAEIGTKLGLTVWLPKGDRGSVFRYWDAHPDLPERLPLNYDSTTNETIENIDVIWMRGRSIARAFEVEHSTSVYSGLLRMADLLALQPNLNIKLHIVAPEERRGKVAKELRRPVFSVVTNGALADSCSFLSYDVVRELADMPHLSYMTDAIVDRLALGEDPDA